MEKLFGNQLNDLFTPWREQLGKTDGDSLTSLISVATKETSSLAQAFHLLYKDHAEDKAQNAFRSFRKRVNDAAKAHNIPYRLHVDSKKRSAPADRCFWFTGPDPSIANAEQFSADSVSGLPPYIPRQGIATTSDAMATGKRAVKIFLSYAHADQPLVDKLMEELRNHFAASKTYEMSLWLDRHIDVGAKWNEEIQQAIEACDFGLLMVSPAFLASSYITKHELPKLLDKAIPVGLSEVLFNLHDLKGLEQHQIFLHEGTAPFSKLTRRRRDFCARLFEKIEARLNQHFAAPRVSAGLTAAAQELDFLPPNLDHHYEPARGARANPETAETPLGSEEDALSALKEWIHKPNAPFFALLGEYGIGKTTTLKKLTIDLLADRKFNPQTPLPIYIDLRDYVGAQKDYVPTIDELLTSVIARNHKLTNRNATAADLLRLVREEGAVILFDGLDEKIVHLTPDLGRAFIRTLWSVLPDFTQPAKPGTRRGKFLISCRSHYFRDVWSQNAMLSGEDREGIDVRNYPVLCLLPFNEEQIRNYLKAFTDGDEERAQEIYSLIESVHNLRDLAERPYLLKLITEQTRDLEAIRLRGGVVNAATLYDLVVRKWLDRDDGKHQINPRHKRAMMEELAAALWRDGVKSWSADQLEDWLDRYLYENPITGAAYAAKDRDILKEDLRTATFVLRPDSEKSNFRFAHTSLQEYFLAAHLVHALRDNKPGKWDLPLVSVETLDFIGQIIQLEKTPLEGLSTMMGREPLRAAVLAFRYWLRAIEKELPEPPTPPHVRLAGANLDEWTISGRSEQQPLPLRGADLTGARLNRSDLRWVDLSEAAVTGLEVRQASWNRVRTDGWDWSVVSANGLISFPSTPQAPVRDAIPWHLTGHSQGVNRSAFSPDGSKVVSASDDKTLRIWDPSSGQSILTLYGHYGSVLACAWSPDGSKILSASADNTLRIWDLSSGQSILTLSDHSSSVMACGWSPDGSKVVSASADRTLRIWNSTSGQSILTLSGDSSFLACAWSPDGSKILSASLDSTLCIWNPSFGHPILTLSGHSECVMACSWSPDGSKILSASLDNTLCIWNPSSGQSILTLSDHSSSVMACAWSPDGTKVVSASADKTLRIWNPSSGQPILTLSGHSECVRDCAWSPDGSKILSASDDKNLRIWNAASGQSILTLCGQPSSVRACGWSPDKSKIVSTSDETVRIWSEPSQVILTLSGHADFVRDCAWSPDSARIVSASNDKTLRIWNAVTGQSLCALLGHSASVRACAWSPDSSQIVSASSDNTLRIWNAESGQSILTLSGHSGWVAACAWSPDGSQVVSASFDKTLAIWNAVSGQSILTLSGHFAPIRACGWSPDGSRIVSGSDDGTLRIWNAAASAQSILTLFGHSDSVWACGWSPDGSQIVSASSDNTIRIWNAASGLSLLTLPGHSDSVWACEWSLDGSKIVSASGDDTLRIWDAKTGKCLEVIAHMPKGEYAWIDERANKIRSCSPGAWKHLTLRHHNPETGEITLYPADAFGPLPIVYPPDPRR